MAGGAEGFQTFVESISVNSIPEETEKIRILLGEELVAEEAGKLKQ